MIWRCTVQTERQNVSRNYWQSFNQLHHGIHPYQRHRREIVGTVGRFATTELQIEKSTLTKGDHFTTHIQHIFGPNTTGGRFSTSG